MPDGLHPQVHSCSMQRVYFLLTALAASCHLLHQLHTSDGLFLCRHQLWMALHHGGVLPRLRSGAAADADAVDAQRAGRPRRLLLAHRYPAVHGERPLSTVFKA